MVPTHSSSSVAETVRAERMWAGIAALLLCYYGFFAGMIPLSAAADVLLYTAKFGGIAMIISVIALQTGKPLALAYDGVASLLIGGALVVSGIMWLTGGGGFQGFLNIIFGAMFASSGWRNWNGWMRLRPAGAPQARPVHQSPPPDSSEPARPPSTQRPPPPSDSLAGRIKRHRASDTAEPARDAAPPSQPPQPKTLPSNDSPSPGTKTPDFSLEPPAPEQPPADLKPTELSPDNLASCDSKDADPAIAETDEPSQTKPAQSKPAPTPPPQGFLASFAEPPDTPTSD